MSKVCKDFTGRIDLNITPKTWRQKISYMTHISICRVCREYLNMSRLLRLAIQRLSKVNNLKLDSARMDQLNRDLLEKYKKL